MTSPPDVTVVFARFARRWERPAFVCPHAALLQRMGGVWLAFETDSLWRLLFLKNLEAHHKKIICLF